MNQFEVASKAGSKIKAYNGASRRLLLVEQDPLQCGTEVTITPADALSAFASGVSPSTQIRSCVHQTSAKI